MPAFSLIILGIFSKSVKEHGKAGTKQLSQGRFVRKWLQEGPHFSSKVEQPRGMLPAERALGVYSPPPAIGAQAPEAGDGNITESENRPGRPGGFSCKIPTCISAPALVSLTERKRRETICTPARRCFSKRPAWGVSFLFLFFKAIAVG